MAINFPDNPVNGNQYTYNDIVYTYKKSGSNEGYWTVLTPSSVGVATPTEIDEGTNNEKYASPQGLAGSKYVREDEASGETVLNATGEKRFKTTAQGVEVTGKLVLGSDVVKDGNTVPIVIEQGKASTGSGTFHAYRLWSDGLIENWAKVPYTGVSVDRKTGTWLKPFTDLDTVMISANVERIASSGAAAAYTAEAGPIDLETFLYKTLINFSDGSFSNVGTDTFVHVFSRGY